MELQVNAAAIVVAVSPKPWCCGWDRRCRSFFKTMLWNSWPVWGFWCSQYALKHWNVYHQEGA